MSKKIAEALLAKPRPASMVGDMPMKSRQRHPDNQGFLEKYVFGTIRSPAEYADGPEVNRRVKKDRR